MAEIEKLQKWLWNDQEDPDAWVASFPLSKNHPAFEQVVKIAREHKELLAKEGDIQKVIVENADRLQEADFEAIGKKILEGMKEELDQSQASKPELKFHSIEDFMSSAEYTPFSHSSPEDLALTTKVVGNIQTLASLEESLGVSIQNLPLRSQVYLLKTMEGTSETDFSRLQGILQKFPESSDNILYSFLGTSHRQDFAEKILSLAENGPEEVVSAVFKSYRDVSKNVEEATKIVVEEPIFKKAIEERAKEMATYLKKRAERSGEELSTIPSENELVERITASESSSIAGSLIARANRLIDEVSNEIEGGNPNLKQLNRKLERLEAGTLADASALKHLICLLYTSDAADE